MRLQGDIVVVLLIDKEAPRIVAMRVYLVQAAAGFLARFSLQLVKESCNLCFFPAFAIHVTASTTMSALLCAR